MIFSCMVGLIRRKVNKASRALTCFCQALLVLVWFRKGEDKTTLGAGFGVSRSTAYRYVAEAVRVLAAQTPSLQDALRRRRRLTERLGPVPGISRSGWYTYESMRSDDDLPPLDTAGQRARGVACHTLTG